LASLLVRDDNFNLPDYHVRQRHQEERERQPPDDPLDHHHLSVPVQWVPVAVADRREGHSAKVEGVPEVRALFLIPL